MNEVKPPMERQEIPPWYTYHLSRYEPSNAPNPIQLDLGESFVSERKGQSYEESIYGNNILTPGYFHLSAYHDVQVGTITQGDSPACVLESVENLQESYELSSQRDGSGVHVELETDYASAQHSASFNKASACHLILKVT